jgi:hypothetical protein
MGMARCDDDDDHDDTTRKSRAFTYKQEFLRMLELAIYYILI